MSVHGSGKSYAPKLGTKDRRAKRRKVYLGELTSVELQFDNGNIECEVIDLSPSGVGVVANKGEFIPARGDRVYVTYGNRFGKKFKSWGVVASCESILLRGQSKLRMGVAFAVAADRAADVVNEESAQRMRIACPLGYLPPAYCEDPFFFHERVHFQIVEFSATGMRAKTSGFHATLLPNVVLNLTVFLPMLGMYKLEARIEAVIQDKASEQFILDFELLGNVTLFKNDVSQYLLMSRAVDNVEDLRERMFVVENLERALSFRYASGEEDFADVARLRETPLDKYDEFSRQILCTIGDNIIACARLVFTDGDPTRSEFEGMLRGIPQKYWTQKFVESSRFYCVPGFSAKDVYISFLRHFVRITAESGARYLLMACSAKAFKLYETLGFRRVVPVGEQGETATSGMVVVAMDVHRLLSSNGIVEATVFNRYYADIAKHVGCTPKTVDGVDDAKIFWTRK